MTEEEIKAMQEQIEAEKAEKEALMAEVAEKNEKLKGYEGKEMNFNKVRDAAEKAEKEKDEIKSKLEKELDDERMARINDRKEVVIGAIAGKDEELKKLVEFHYSKFSGDAKTPEEIEARAKEAYVLATKGQSNPVKQQQSAGSAGGVVNAGTANREVDPEVKTWANEFNKYGAGITDEALVNKNKK